MAVFFEPLFITVVALVYVAVQLNTRLPRTTWFGLLNLGAVALLFGYVPALALLAGSFAYWIAIAAVARMQDERSKLARAGRFVLYTSVGLVLIAYKVSLDPSANLANLLGLPAFVPPKEGASHHVAEIFQTLAFSYVALRIVDVIRAGLAGERLLNPVALSGFLVPFFMTPSGPVNEYEAHAQMDRTVPPPVSAGRFIDASFTIVLGYFLKFVVAQLYSLFFIGVSGKWPTESLGDTAIFLLFVLIEFSGYSLIALGIGRLIGVPTPVNFNHPYLSRTFTEFWTRWHISLGAFVRRTLYFPVRLALTRIIQPGKDDKLTLHAINAVALEVSFGFVGLWHRLTFAFLFWGLVLAAVVFVETVVRQELVPRIKIPIPQPLIAPLGIVYTLFLVVLTLQIAVKDFAG